MGIRKSSGRTSGDEVAIARRTAWPYLYRSNAVVVDEDEALADLCKLVPFLCT